MLRESDLKSLGAAIFSMSGTHVSFCRPSLRSDGLHTF